MRHKLTTISLVVVPLALSLQAAPPITTVTLTDGQSYDFDTKTAGSFTGGDLYYGMDKFWANNVGQQGLQDLGAVPLLSISSIPTTGYSRQGVATVVGHSYISLAEQSEPGNHIFFTVTGKTSTAVTVNYIYGSLAPASPITTVTLTNGQSYDFDTKTAGQFVTGGDLYYLVTGGDKFWANNVGQQGLQDVGAAPLLSISSIPTTGYSGQGVAAVVGHSYISLAEQSEPGNYIFFTVTGKTSSTVTLNYIYGSILPAALCPSIQLSASYVGSGAGPTQASVRISAAQCIWSVTSNATWIGVSSGASGSGNATVRLSISANSGLTRSGTVIIGGQTLTVLQAGTDLSAPFGHIDTPINGSTNQAGAINFTGWALSSITVAQVALCREPVAGEAIVTDPHCLISSSPNGLVYLGNAVLVPGVRPDVATAFSGYPNNDWGWGAQILTNYLPGTNGMPLGNGTYKLHAIAADAAGLSTDLGTTTISANNAASVLPFGTIDTPGQGETVSGANYINFGWVVTPQPNIVPIDGSTITVHIDGVAVGHPAYNNFRSDIASLFPGLRNSNGAVGFFAIDTTKLSNGIHNIDWVATDSLGHTAGIGSRNFFVSN